MLKLTFVVDTQKTITTNNLNWLFSNIITRDIQSVIINGKELPFLEKDFIPYFDGEIDYEQLLNQLDIKLYIRNKISIESKHFSIDEGSLWELKNNICILIHTDFYYECEYCHTIFE